jgi:Mn2+/Fe2+ NRAMP family transporter
MNDSLPRRFEFNGKTEPTLRPEPPGVHWLRMIVPGIVAGAADLDPAAVLTATVAGATFGYSVGWVVLASIPVLWSVFSVSSRIGRDSRKGLVELIRESYGRTSGRLLALAIFVVNFAMIIGDLVAVSEALSIITRHSRVYFLAPLGFTVWYMLIVGDARRTMEKMGLLSVALLAYVGAAILASPSAATVASGIVFPRVEMSSAYAMAVIAVFGSLLTPDVIVWQTSSRRDVPTGLKQNLLGESHAGTLVATVVSLSAIIAASSTLKTANAGAMTTRAAAEALHPLGPLAPILFSVGIIGSGLVALPLLAGSLSFSIAEALGWESGLSKAPWEAQFFYVVISGVLLFAVAIAFAPINTVKLLYGSQVLAGALSIPILGSLLMLGNRLGVVRKRNRRFDNTCLSIAVVGMVIANIMFVWNEWVKKLMVK